MTAEPGARRKLDKGQFNKKNLMMSTIEMRKTFVNKVKEFS